MKDIKTDTSRMCDLHADVFYQQDSAFSELDITNSKYRPQELSKKRGQPITLDYDVTFITKYREDLDQIISNFAVHFRPDIYLKWWHPRNKKSPLTSQLIWSHSVNFDSQVDYNPQNIFVYKGTTSFTFKSWLFYGMDATDHTIDKSLESVIKRIKLFPNRTSEEVDGNPSDTNDSDNTWVFGNIENKDRGTLGFYSVNNSQEFIGNDSEKTLNGDYVVNNVFNQLYPEISGNELFNNIKTNSDVADFFSNYNENDINNFNKYQLYLMIDTPNIKNQSNALVKNVFYKGSFPASSFYKNPPSGDYMFRKFFSIQTNNYGQIKEKEFGQSFIEKYKMKVEYDINTKNLLFWSKFETPECSYYLKSKFNSTSGSFQEAEIKSKSFTHFDDYIAYSFHKEYDINLNNITENNVSNTHNLIPINEQYAPYATKLYIDDYEVKSTLITLKNYLKAHWKTLNLIEKENSIYNIEFEDSKAGQIEKEKGLSIVEYRALKMIGQTYLDGYYYQILVNKYIYIILKTNANNEDDCDIYDFGVLFPLKYASYKALIYEITIPESRELLGLNFYLGF